MHRQHGWVKATRGHIARLAAVCVMICGAAAARPGGLPALAAAPGPLACVPFARTLPAPGAVVRHDRRTGVAIDGPAKYSAGVRADVFPKGAPVDVSLTVRNTGTTAVMWSFATAQRFDAVLYDGDCREIWRWSRGRMFAQALGTLTVEPGGIVTYRIRWDQRDENGRQVRPGAYEVRVVFLGKRTPGAALVVMPPLELGVR